MDFLGLPCLRKEQLCVDVLIRLLKFSASATLISGPYLVALALSMVEHALECRYAPWLKQQALASYTGLAMVVVGETLRKVSVMTANKNFTHDIKVDKRQEHKLVTHGIYRYSLSHPQYVCLIIAFILVATNNHSTSSLSLMLTLKNPSVCVFLSMFD